MEDNIDKIRADLYQIANSEYEKNGYKPIKTSAKELKNPDGFNEKDVEKELNNYQNKVKMMVQKKNKNALQEEEAKKDFMDNTLDTFNIVEDEKEYKEWRKLDLPERLEILEKHFKEFPDLGDDIKEQLRDMVDKQKILYKKDINYDKINKKILKITLLKKVGEEYVLKEDVKKVNIRKKNHNNIKKTFLKN